MTSPKLSFATLILLSAMVTVVVTLGVLPLLALTGSVAGLFFAPATGMAAGYSTARWLGGYIEDKKNN